MDTKQPIRYLSIVEAAEYSRVPYENFRYHANKGRIPMAAMQGDKRLYITSDLDSCELLKALRKKHRNRE